MAAEGVKFNQSIYTPFVTLCTFLSQVLDPDHSCRAAVVRVIVWLAIHDREPCSEQTGTYCDARLRLPLGSSGTWSGEPVGRSKAAPRRSGSGRDDACCWLTAPPRRCPIRPATKRSSPSRIPRPKGWGSPWSAWWRSSRWPLGSSSTWRRARTGERDRRDGALLRQLWERLEAGEILLGDCVFASFFGILGLTKHSVDGLFRMHQRRKCDFRRGRRLGVEDHVVVWTKPVRPEWMDQATYERAPATLEVREIRFKVERPGFRVDELVLVTTMVDGGQYSKEELADLFLKRWHIELDFRSIKCALKMEVLRCQSPEMVVKEIWMHLLAYNLIRGVMAEAARRTTGSRGE